MIEAHATPCYECGTTNVSGPICLTCNPNLFDAPVEGEKQDQGSARRSEDRIAPTPQEGRAWRPIETAPRDGTALIAGSTNHDHREVVCWQDGEPSGTITDEPCEGWVNHGTMKDRFYANPLWFTHWMPLPAAPEAGQ